MKVKIGPYNFRPKLLVYILEFFFKEEKAEKIIKKIDSLFERRIYVKIDEYDIWNLDETLSHIIHPALVRYKAINHGIPTIDDVDVPEHIKKPEDKWNFVLDEMIYAFEKSKEGQINVIDKRRKNGLRLFGKYYEALWD